VEEWLTQLEELTATSPAPERLPELLQRVDALAEAAPDVAAAVEEVEHRLDASANAVLLRYARARLQERLGQTAAARGYARVAAELGQVEQWEAAHALVRHALRLSSDPDWVPLLLETSGHLAEPAVRREDLALAAHLAPQHPQVLWAQAQAAQAEGKADRAAELLLRALRGFIETGDALRAEDAVLMALDNPSAALTHHLLDLLPTMGEQDMLPLAEVTADLLEPVVDKFHLGPRLVQALEQTLVRASEGLPSLRRRYLQAVVRLRGDAPAVSAAAEETGLTDPAVPFARALPAFQAALALARGALVKHRTWGVGRIRAVSESGLVVDFPEHKGQAMARSMAQRSLRPVSPQSLEAVMYLHGPALREEARQDPVALLLRVIDEVGGKASVGDFKQWLAGAILPEASWNAWWKGAREAAAQDPRIDHSHAFEGDYRRAGSGGRTAVRLPALKRADGLAAGARMIQRLLKQHPELEEAAREKYGPVLADWVEREETNEGRLAAALLLGGWYPQERRRWAAVVARLIVEARALNLLHTGADQQVALDLVLDSDDPDDALVMALGSRFGVVREAARERLVALGEALVDLLWAYLQSEQAPVPVQVEIIRLALHERARWESSRDPWVVLLAALDALSQAKAQRDIVALAEMLRPEGALADLLGGRPCPPEREHNLESSLLTLSRYHRRAAVVRDFLAATGHEQYTPHLEPPRPAAESQRVIPERNPQVLLMTRETYEAKVERREQLRRELAGEIPRLIAAARALGDLSENADYHAARERQGLAAAEVRALDATIDHARILEDLRIHGDQVTAGTEVLLRELPSGAERTVWLLGQDDNYHGPEVVNYRAAIGQALLEHKPGDQVTVESEGEAVTYEVVSVRKRLPEVKKAGPAGRRGMFTD
jgi:transcription elongation factor GreA